MDTSRYDRLGFAFNIRFGESIGALGGLFRSPPSVNSPFGFHAGTFCFVCPKSSHVPPDTWDQFCHGAGLWICGKLGAACIL